MHTLVKILETLNQWHWIGFAAVLTILEVALGASFFLLWLGVSAATVGMIMFIYPQLSWEYQFVAFALESIACLGFWNFHLKHNPHISDQPNLNRRNQQYIGRVVTLQEPIINGRGRIHVDDSFWRVEGPDLPVGTEVQIIDVDGVVLKIRKN